MNTNLASYIMGMVIDENDHFYFVQKDGQTYALDKAEGPHQVGESVKGFAYTDMKQKLRLTTLEVTATQESFGWGTVTEVRKDLGCLLYTSAFAMMTLMVRKWHFSLIQKDCLWKYMSEERNG